MINPRIYSLDPRASLKDKSYTCMAIIPPSLSHSGMLEVLLFLEETFGIKVADNEMVPENLDSVNRIAAFVARKKA